MTNFSQGDVILTEIAFSGEPGRKRRPAVVISIDEFNRAGTKLIVAAVTSNISPPFRRGDVLLVDWQKDGLVKPSAVRGVLATIDKKDIVRPMGHLTEKDFTKVESAVADLLGFTQKRIGPDGQVENG